MPTSPVVIELQNEYGHELSSWLTDCYRYSRKKGQVPTGGRGYRQVLGQFLEDSLFAAAIGPTARFAREAPDAVQAAERLRPLAAWSPLLPGATFRNAIEGLFVRYADRVEELAGKPLLVREALEVITEDQAQLSEAVQAGATERRHELTPSRISIPASLEWVAVEWDGAVESGLKNHVDIYGGKLANPEPPPIGPGYLRFTSIHGRMLEVFGALLSDSRAELRRLGIDPSLLQKQGGIQERVDVDSAPSSTPPGSNPSSTPSQPPLQGRRDVRADPMPSGYRRFCQTSRRRSLAAAG